MKLLDTNGGNTKIRKNNANINDGVFTMIGEVMGKKPSGIRVAGLSLAPSNWACPRPTLPDARSHASCRQVMASSTMYGRVVRRKGIGLGMIVSLSWIS